MRRFLLILILMGVLTGIWQWYALSVPEKDARAAIQPPPSLVVKTAQARIKAIPVTLGAVGQVESAHSVAVRPQVTGMLDNIAFKDGAYVKAGQLLFEIDPAPFKAMVDEAQATLKKDRANLAHARWQMQRLTPLMRRGYATPQDYQSAKTAVQRAIATIAADEANLQQAEIRLDYTTIRSPITGRAGAVFVKTGNLVEANGAIPLVTINQLSPILIRFTVPQNTLDLVRRYQANGPILVRANAGQDNSRAPVEGQLVFIDNMVDPATGTVMLKARFPNHEQRLWPGEYLPVSMVLTVQSDAVVVPETAIQPGQNGTFVYVVKDGAAHVRPVKVARQRNALAVIAKGLKLGEAVVTQVPRNLRDGLAVQTRAVEG